jgi:hypothetical protein
VNLVLWIAVILASGLVVFWTLVLKRYGHERQLQFGDAAVVSMFSVALGLAAGFLSYDAQRATSDDREREELRALLEVELADTRRVLSTGERWMVLEDGKKYEFLITFVQSPALERASARQLFSVSDRSEMLQLMRKIRVFNLNTDLSLSYIKANAPGNQLQTASDNVEQSRQAVLDAIDEVSVRQGLHVK